MSLTSPLDARLEDVPCGPTRLIAEVLGSLAAGVGVPSLSEAGRKLLGKHLVLGQGNETFDPQGKGEHRGDAQGNHYGSPLLHQAEHGFLLHTFGGFFLGHGEGGEEQE